MLDPPRPITPRIVCSICTGHVCFCALYKSKSSKERKGELLQTPSRHVHQKVISMFIRRLQKGVVKPPKGRRQRKVPNNIGKTPGRCQRQKKEIPLQLPLYPKTLGQGLKSSHRLSSPPPAHRYRFPCQKPIQGQASGHRSAAQARPSSSGSSWLDLYCRCSYPRCPS